MAFTIPNNPDAAFADQAEVDARDFDILVAGINRTGVVSGCGVTSTGSGNGSINVAAGIVRVDNVIAQVTAGSLQHPANSSGNPRFDLVTVDTAGAEALVVGTPAAAPVFPAIPAGRVVIAAVRVPNGHTVTSTVPSNTIVDKRVLLGSSRQVYHDVRDHGAVGTNDTSNVSAVDCSAAFVAAAAAANLCILETLKSDANGTGVVYLPGNCDWKITITVEWPQNVQFIGGTGTGNNTAQPPRVRWHGTAGEPMFRHQTDNPNIVGIHVQCIKFDGRGGPSGGDQAGYLLGAGYGWWFGPTTTGAAKPDTGCQFIDCHIAAVGLNGVHFAGIGLTNWVWERGRFDWISGYAIYALTTGNCFLSINNMTYDNWPASDASNSGRSKGFLFLDGETGNGKSFVGLTNLHLEVNGGYAQTSIPTGWSPTGADTRGLIRLGVNTGASNVVQHKVTFSNIWIPINGTHANPFSVFQITSPDLTSDNRNRHAAAVQISGMNLHGLNNGTSPFGEGTQGACKMIGGVSSTYNYPFNPASGGVRQVGFFSFHPTVAGVSVPSNEQTVDFFGGRMLVRELNLPQQGTVGAAGGGPSLPATPVKYLVVYDDAGTKYVVPAYNA